MATISPAPLRPGKSPRETPPSAPRNHTSHSTATPKRCEVLVIGGGISGKYRLFFYEHSNILFRLGYMCKEPMWMRHY